MSPRRRRLRSSYPLELMHLAVLLAQTRGRRDVAAVLGVPLSTVYRWLHRHRRQPAFDARQGGEAMLHGLVAACRAHGVRLAGISLERAPRGVVPVAASAPGRAGAVSDDVRRRLQLVRDKIDREYFTHLSCDEFGRIASMSKYNLINRFRYVYGVSPYRYLLQVRIRHARKLLGSTPASLGAVATAVGFDSQSSLSKSFRNIEGFTLAEFCRGVRGAATAARDAHRAETAQSLSQSL